VDGTGRIGLVYDGRSALYSSEEILSHDAVEEEEGAMQEESKSGGVRREFYVIHPITRNQCSVTITTSLEVPIPKTTSIVANYV